LLMQVKRGPQGANVPGNTASLQYELLDLDALRGGDAVAFDFFSHRPFSR